MEFRILNMEKIKMKTFKEFKAEMRKRPGYKEAYDALEVEFKIRGALINERIKGFSQKQLAKNLGVTQIALKRFEADGEDPAFSFIQKVTAGLGLRLVVK